MSKLQGQADALTGDEFKCTAHPGAKCKGISNSIGISEYLGTTSRKSVVPCRANSLQKGTSLGER